MTMETQFTSGPWQVGGRSATGALYVMDAEDEPIDFWIDANQYLVAAAPDLYAALRNVIDSLNNFEVRPKEPETSGLTTMDFYICLGLASEALAKARGE